MLSVTTACESAMHTLPVVREKKGGAARSVTTPVMDVTVSVTAFKLSR